MTPPRIQTFFDAVTFSASHVVSCPRTRKAAVLDCEPKSGRLPPPEDNGTRYLKIALDVL